MPFQYMDSGANTRRLAELKATLTDNFVYFLRQSTPLARNNAFVLAVSTVRTFVCKEWASNTKVVDADDLVHIGVTLGRLFQTRSTKGFAKLFDKQWNPEWI